MDEDDKRTEDFFEGYNKGIDEGLVFGLSCFAWWKNGVQYVGQQCPDGTGALSLQEAIERAKKLKPIFWKMQ